MPDVRLTWTIKHHGWALCSVKDEHTSAEAFASYVTDGPEQLTIAIRLVEAAGWRTPEHEGSLLWQSEQPTTALARTVLRAFDTVANDLGEAGYRTLWGCPFPRHELEVLRTAWRGASPTLR